MIKYIRLRIICHRTGKSIRSIIIFILGIKIQIIPYIQVKKTVIIVIKPDCSNAEFDYQHQPTFAFFVTSEKVPFPLFFNSTSGP